jgi:hypothetical protein
VTVPRATHYDLSYGLEAPSVDVILAIVVGFVLGIAAVWLVEREGRGRRQGAVHHFGTARSSVAPLVRSPHQVPPAEMAALRRSVDQLVQVDASALRHVIGVGAVSVVGELTVELIAIEIRDAGCRGILRFRDGRGTIDAGPPFTPVGEPEVTVADDLGTAYETGLAGWSGSASGGEAEFHFAPRPPAQARRLSIGSERFSASRLPPDGPWSGPREGTPEPWTFTVEIEPAG